MGSARRWVGQTWSSPMVRLLSLLCSVAMVAAVTVAGSGMTRQKRQGILFQEESPNMRDTFDDSLGPCPTPARSPGDEGLPGHCVPIQKCPDLLQFLKGPTRDIGYLRRTICRIINATPYVCCPLPPPPTEPPVTDGLQTLNNGEGGPLEDRSLLPNPDNYECGAFLTDRIVGGKNALRFSWPWIALLYYDVKGVGLKHGCGGSLISRRYVLTAAHCIDETGSAKLVKVRLGEYDLRTDPDCDEGGGPVKRECTSHLDVDVEEIIVHPQYTQHRFKGAKNDIALVRLKEDMNLSVHTHIVPVCLPWNSKYVDEAGDTSLPNKRAKVAGWGRISVEFRNNGSDILQELDVPVISASKCRETPAFKRVDFGDEHLCAGGERGKDSCKGDSGGPLVVPGVKPLHTLSFQIGVVSFGTPYCGLIEAPGVYTRVSTYVDWIREVIKP